MSTTFPTVESEFDIASIPIGQIAPRAVSFGTLALIVSFFISADQGAISVTAARHGPATSL